MLDVHSKIIYNPSISCEAEITSEYDLSESGKGWNPRRKRSFKWTAERAGELYQYPATGRDRYIAGNVLAFPKRARFDRETRWHRESIVLVSA